LGDLTVGETFQDAVYIVTTETGVAKTGLTPTATMVRISNNTRTPLTVQEVGSGWYRVTTFTPSAAGAWAVEWAVAGAYTIKHEPKIFKVGGGQVDEIDTAIDAVKGSGWSADTDNLEDMRDENVGGFSMLVSIDGLATGNGAADGTTVVDSARTEGNDFWNGQTLLILSGSYSGQARRIVDFTAVSDTFTVYPAFSGQIVTGVNYVILPVRPYSERTETWFSVPQEEVAVTNAAGDKALPSVVLPDIAGVIVRVKAGFLFRAIEETSGGANKLSGNQEIQVKENAAGSFIDAINFKDDQFGIAASTREGGGCVVGAINVASEVAAFNKTYAFQWDEAVADAANLQFNDVQTFLVVTFYD